MSAATESIKEDSEISSQQQHFIDLVLIIYQKII